MPSGCPTVCTLLPTLRCPKSLPDPMLSPRCSQLRGLRWPRVFLGCAPPPRSSGKPSSWSLAAAPTQGAVLSKDPRCIWWAPSLPRTAPSRGSPGPATLPKSEAEPPWHSRRDTLTSRPASWTDLKVADRGTEACSAWNHRASPQGQGLLLRVTQRESMAGCTGPGLCSCQLSGGSPRNPVMAEGVPTKAPSLSLAQECPQESWPVLQKVLWLRLPGLDWGGG